MGSSPKGYVELAVSDLTKDQRMKFSAIILGLALIIIVSITMARFVDFVRPSALDLGMTKDQEGRTVISMGSMFCYFAVLVLVLVVHELVHGVVFWWVSGEKPTVGLKGAFVYVSAPPSVYFQRNKYLWVGAAPMITLTLAGVLLVPFLPPSLLPLDIFFVAINAAGSAGDLVIICKILRYPASSLIRDIDSGMIIYGLKDP